MGERIEIDLFTHFIDKLPQCTTFRLSHGTLIHLEAAMIRPRNQLD